jgi:soluble lytic murein transglycosylase-like protein
MTALRSAAQGLRTFASDIAEGFFEITHNSFALVGLAVVFAVVTLTARPDLRQAGEEQLVSWLQARKAAVLGMEPELEAVDRATATNPKDLPREQAAVAYWLSKKYRVAPEPLSALVVEAYEVGQRAKLDPTLILAIMAVESSFNPFAQSAVGAQGLMQVMTHIHSDKYENFGGKLAAFDPVTNLAGGREGAAGMHCPGRFGRRGPEAVRRRRQQRGRRRLRWQGDGRACPPGAGRQRPCRADQPTRQRVRSSPPLAR